MNNLILFSFADSKISLNGSIISSVPLKNRPRIPTPDVGKDGADKENNRFQLAPVTLGITNAGTSGQPITTTSGITSGVALIPQHLGATLFLSPIKEQDSGSVHNTLQAGSPAAKALANTITLQPNADWRTGEHIKQCTICRLDNNNHFLFGSVSVMNQNASLTQISLPISTSTGSGPKVIPIDQTMNTVTTTQGVLPVTFATVPVSLANYTTAPLVPTPQQSNVIITEVFSDKEDPDENDSSAELSIPPVMNRRNSMSTSAAKQIISRKVSEGSQSIDSPNLPKRNQPVTTSAPSTLTKSKPESKTGEVYV